MQGSTSNQIESQSNTTELANLLITLMLKGAMCFGCTESSSGSKYM